MASFTVIMLTLSQLFTPFNEGEYNFCKSGKNTIITINDARRFFSVKSQNYPKKYDKNKDCKILLQMNRNYSETFQTLLLSCSPKFRMQKRVISTGKCVDFLQVDDATFCGTDFAKNGFRYIMKGPLNKNGVLLRFKSDDTETADDKGFHCEAVIDKKNTCSQHFNLSLPENTVADIVGLNLKRTEHSQIDCMSRIKVQNGYAIKFVVKQFNLHPEDGEYCLVIGLEHQFCSRADGVKNQWPPLSFVSQPHNGYVNIRLLAHSLSFGRTIDFNSPSFVLQAMLYRGKETVGSASNLIFSDVSKVNISNQLNVPKPPIHHTNYRKVMLPVQAPKQEDSCVCWEFPPDNIFINMMAAGAKFNKTN